MKRYLSLLFIATSLIVLQGCATSITKGSDRRTEGAYIEDGSIENTATERIKKKYQGRVHINVNSYNRKVLVTGDVADEAVKAEITRIIITVQNVNDVFNELSIGPLSGLSARSGDAVTTSNVKLRMQNTKKEFFRSDRIKVVTEKDIVYLLGLVTRAEADVATEVASTSGGVKKVVPLFQFID